MIRIIDKTVSAAVKTIQGSVGQRTLRNPQRRLLFRNHLERIRQKQRDCQQLNHLGCGNGKGLHMHLSV